MNRIQVWFIVIAGLLGLGIPFLFLGLELPNAMHAAIMNEAAEYVVLDEEDFDFWSVIPGRTGMVDMKSYYIFECQNQEAVAARGEKPKFIEVGPFNYSYTHNLAKRQYSDEDEVKNSRVSYIREFSHTFHGNSDDLKKEHWAVNVAGMKRWFNVKNKERFQLAIEGFFELFTYAKYNFIRDTIIQTLIRYFHQLDHIYDLTKGLDVRREITRALAYDHYYGLLQEENVYEWTVMCDTVEPYIEHEILYYFGFNLTQFEKVKLRFCDIYSQFREDSRQKICSKLVDCSMYNISYQQWQYDKVLNGKHYSDITHKTIFGFFEYAVFEREYFFKNLNPDYKQQFASVKWDDKSYWHLLDTYHEFKGFETDEGSLLLFENMRLLFLAGQNTPSPYKKAATSDGATTIDLSRFEHIARKSRISKEQAFMMYCYFDFFVDNTVLLKQYGGTVEKERMGHYGALTYKDLSYYYKDYLDIVLYCRALHTRNSGRNCEETVRYYFSMNETNDLMTDLVYAICLNEKFTTDVSKAVGWKYFVEAVAFPYHFFYWNLQYYLIHAVKDFKRETLEAMLNGAKSQFAIELHDIKVKVRDHYNSKTNDEACGINHKFSQYCTKREIFFSQFHDSAITRFPYPESKMPSSDYVADWWHIIRDYVEYLIGDAHPMHPSEQSMLPERPIEVPVEFAFLTKYFGKSSISKTELYNYFVGTGIYDTDVLYYIFLNLKDPSKVGKYRNFASSFFFNSTRYLIRNVEFGPMFDEMLPENIIFGYHNNYIEAEHKVIDYLDGDDCTINPSIGWNPYFWQTTDLTFEHLKLRQKMHTGAEVNSDIRKYDYYCESDTLIYRELVFDETGDECYFDSRNPFTTAASVVDSTDGYQFNQTGGKSVKGAMKVVLDRDLQRPMQLVRPNNLDYDYKGLLGNPYVMPFKSDFGCKKGLFMRNALDMTSFLQLHSVMTKPQFKGIDEPGIIKPIMTYTHSLEKEEAPYSIPREDSFYMVEPYTGLTLWFSKKMMLSIVLYYDELYDKLPEGGHGEILPYYSMYETGKVSDSFIDMMEKEINNARSSRKATMVSFTVFGLIFVFTGIGMIARAFFFKEVVSDTSDSEASDKKPEPRAVPENKEVVSLVVSEPTEEPTQEKLLLRPDSEGEDLQKDDLPEEESKGHSSQD